MFWKNVCCSKSLVLGVDLNISGLKIYHFDIFIICKNNTLDTLKDKIEADQCSKVSIFSIR